MESPRLRKSFDHAARGGVYLPQLQVQVVLMEMSVLPYNKGAPLIGEMVAELGRLGFVLSDITEQHRHFLDGSLVQVDGIFTRADSRLRRQPPYF